MTIGVLVCLSGWGGSLLAQAESSKLYVQVGFWDVPRAKWDAFVQFFEKHEKPVMERMVAEGVLVEWGIDANGLHDPEDYSHSTWIVAHDLGSLEKAMAAYYAYLGADAARLEAEFASMVTKHRDMIMISENGAGRTAKLESGYFQASSVRVKRGRMNDFEKAWKELSQPIFEHLLKDGTILAYGLDTPYYHTSEASLGMMVTWYVIADMANDAKVDAAFEAAQAKRSETERAALRDYFWGMTVEGSHRDAFTRLIHYQRR
jgi:hypothetical protein